MKNFLFCLFVCLLFTHSANGQAIWQQYQGPFTGDIYSFTSKGDTIFAGANISGVFRSTDSGETWQSTGLKEGTINCMLAYGSKLFAGNGSYFLVSNDNGLNWSKLQTINGEIRKFYLFNNHIYLGTSEGVYIYNPSTNSLSIKNQGLGSEVTSGSKIIQAFASINNILFCGTFDGGLFKSTDEGDTWEKIPSSSSFNPTGIKNLLCYGDTIIASDFQNTMTYLSADYGKNWINTSSGLNNNSINLDLAEYNNTIFLSTSAGVYRFNRKTLKWNIFSNEAFAVLSLNNGILLASNKFGVYRYNTVNNRFSLSNSGINTAKILDLALFNKKLYSATESGVFFTEDDGKNWTNISETKDLYSHSIGQNDTMLFLGTMNGVFSTSIHTNTWKSSNTGLTSKIIWDIEAHRNILFAATDSGPFISRNSGKNWYPITNGFRHTTPSPYGTGQIQALAITSGNGMILAANNFGLYKLSADSTRWNLVGFKDEGGQMVKIIDGTVFFCKSSGAFYKSTDGCKSWFKIGNNNPQINIIYDIFKRGNKNLYASGTRYIYYSDDNGKTWDNWYEAGMPDLYIYRVIQGENELFAGTYGKSIWKRKYLDLTDCNSIDFSIYGGKISGVPSNTPADSLTGHLDLAYGADACVKSYSKSESPYVKNGDKVIITAEDGITTQEYEIAGITAIQSETKSNLILYPSPASDRIFLKDITDINTVIIYNMQGDMLMNSKMKDNSIDVSNLKSGIYYISIYKSNGVVITRKIIKQ